MAEVENSAPNAGGDGANGSTPAAKLDAPAAQTLNGLSGSGLPKPTPLHQIYKLPAPIRTFPLPAFYPNNPLSLLYLAWTWTKQLLSPPPAEPSVVWEGIWSPSSRSIHVVNAKAIRALWEQGFYGKGNLSRSEPNWFKREKVRRGLIQTHVSEEMTNARREERNRMKWERARAEQEAIRQTRLEEAQEAARLAELSASEGSLALEVEDLAPPAEVEVILASKAWAAPVDVLTLLALPNSDVDLATQPYASAPDAQSSGLANGIAETQLSNGAHDVSLVNGDDPFGNGTLADPIANVTGHENGAADVNGTAPMHKPTKRRKSVRFSPKVESTTFQHSDPPSPGRTGLNDTLSNGVPQSDAVSSLETETASSLPLVSDHANGVHSEALPEKSKDGQELVDKEHLQLIAEEAFFLSFGLGALKVVDPQTKRQLGTQEMFTLFRQHSHFPPRSEELLQPDDGFLVNYAVYHHFRSLGWVPRPGIKFGMDWLLYAKGPVFDHAEFGLIVMPSYTDAYWKQSGRQIPRKSWHWLHGVVRVLSHVQKSLLLVYVDVPSPAALEAACAQGPAEVFKLYKIKEVTIKRWSGNRNR